MSATKRDKCSADDECVYVQFSGIIDPQLLKDNYSCMKFFGLDGEQPILQIGSNTFFSGQYEHVLGTNVIFEEKDKTNKVNNNNSQNSVIDSELNASSDTNNKSIKSLHYLGKTSKTLVMKRVFLEPKQQQQLIDANNQHNCDNNSS